LEPRRGKSSISDRSRSSIAAQSTVCGKGGGEPMTKGKILQSIWDNLPDERKQRIQARAEELEAVILQTVNIWTLEDCVNSEQKLEQRLCVPQRTSAFKSSSTN
jgi:hypothetical protein